MREKSVAQFDFGDHCRFRLIGLSTFFLYRYIYFYSFSLLIPSSSKFYCGNICLGKSVYGVLYFAGHAFEDNGENFLLPVDADLINKPEHNLRVQEICEEMQQCDTSLNLLITDGCRIK